MAAPAAWARSASAAGLLGQVGDLDREGSRAEHEKRRRLVDHGAKD